MITFLYALFVFSMLFSGDVIANKNSPLNIMLGILYSHALFAIKYAGYNIQVIRHAMRSKDVGEYKSMLPKVVM